MISAAVRFLTWWEKVAQIYFQSCLRNVTLADAMILIASCTTATQIMIINTNQLQQLTSRDIEIIPVILFERHHFQLPSCVIYECFTKKHECV